MKKYQKLVISKSCKKSQNKVGVGKEIDCRNDLVLNKIGQGNELRQKRQIDRLKNRQTDR